MTELPEPSECTPCGHPRICRYGAEAFHREQAPQRPAAELPPGDFYFENGLIVFTAQYHRRRGFCCGSGCRHCPYAKADARHS